MEQIAGGDILNKYVSKERWIKSGKWHLTGGQDRSQRWLITVTADTAGEVSSAEAVSALQYYSQLVHAVLPSHRQLAVLLNLKNSNKQDVENCIDILLKIQSACPGVLSVAYVIAPKSKDPRSHLKKLTGLKPSKKNRQLPEFKVVLVPETSSLKEHIDEAELTTDFGGTRHFDYKTWVSITETLETHYEMMTWTLTRVPGCLDKISLMKEDTPPVSLADAQERLVEIRSSYHDIMRELNIEHCIDKCKAVLDDMRKPTAQTSLSNPTNDLGQKVLESCINQSVKARENLRSAWITMETQMMTEANLCKYTTKAQKIQTWIHDVGLPTTRGPIETAECLSEAEVNKNHFQTGFLTTSKNIIWLADQTLGKLKTLSLEIKNTERRGNIETLIKGCQNITKQFQTALSKKQQLYLSIHSFFTNIHQMTRWYRRTVKFLPLELLNEYLLEGGGVFYEVTQPWNQAVEEYLKLHPAPKPAQLHKLRSILPAVKIVQTRNQARLLMHRIKLMRKILYNTELVTETEMNEIQELKDLLLHGHDNLTRVSSSSWELNKVANSTGSSTWSVFSESLDKETTKDVNNDQSMLTLPRHSTPSVKTRENVNYSSTMKLSRKHNTAKRSLSSSSPAVKSCVDLSIIGATSTKPGSRDNKVGLRCAAPKLQKLTHKHRSKSSHNINQHQSIHHTIPKNLDSSDLDLLQARKSNLHTLPSDDPERYIFDPPKTNKSDLHTLPSDGAERYVSLKCTSNVQLPDSLKHLDLSALENNLPQSVPMSSTPDIVDISKRQAENMKIDSLSQSFQSSQIYQEDTSDHFQNESQLLDDSLCGKSMGNSSSNSAGRVIVRSSSINKTSSFIVHQEEQNSHKPKQIDLAEEKHLPIFARNGETRIPNDNSTLQRNSSFRFEQAAVDRILNSGLSSGEKLKLMADLCRSGSPRSNKLFDRTLQPSTAFQMSSPISHSKSSPEQSISPADTVRTPSETTTEVNDHTKHFISSVDELTVNEQKTADVEANNSNGNLKDFKLSLIHTELLDNWQHHKGTDSLSSLIGQMGIEGTNHCGVDIQDWMQKSEHSSHSDPYSSRQMLSKGNDKEHLLDYIQKLEEIKKERKHEEETLEKEMERLGDLSLEEISMEQTDVARCLDRTERMLRFEEEAMLGHRGMKVNDDYLSEDLPYTAAPQARMRLGYRGSTDMSEVSEGSIESGIYTMTGSGLKLPASLAYGVDGSEDYILEKNNPTESRSQATYMHGLPGPLGKGADSHNGWSKELHGVLQKNDLDPKSRRTVQGQEDGNPDATDHSLTATKKMSTAPEFQNDCYF